jgi:hypothetical protein
VVALFLTAGVAAGPTPGMANTITNGRVTLDLDDPTTGFATRDNDRVDSVSWINRAGISTFKGRDHQIQRQFMRR